MTEKRFFLNKPVVCYPLLGVSGALLSLAFAPYYQIWLAPFLLSFLFIQINQEDKKRYLFCRVFVFGFGVGSVSTAWLANAIMLAGPSFVWLIPLTWLGMGILFGLFYGVPAILASFYPTGLRRLLAWAALFTIFEWIRSWLFTGFPWNLLGSVWENTLPILQTASVTGVYGLSFLTILAGSIWALWPKKKPLIWVVSGMVLLYLIGSVRLWSAQDDVIWGVRLRIVQPNIPQALKWNPEVSEEAFLKLMRLSRQDNDKITHTIWPESAVPFFINRDVNERLRLMQAVRQGGVLMTGGVRIIPDKTKQAANSLFILDDLANILAYYDKAHLVPFGEYVPLKNILPLDKLVPLGVDFTVGPEPQTITIPGTPPFGALVCYEVIFSGKVVDARHRPAWLVNVTNDGWYGISAGPYQHLGMAKMRAVEEGLALVRSANTGVSVVFDGYGRTVKSLPLGTAGVLDTALPAPLPPTLYSKYGAGIPIGLCGLILLFLRIRRK